MPVGPIEHVTKFEKEKENRNYNMRTSRSRERHFEHQTKWKQGPEGMQYRGPANFEKPYYGREQAFEHPHKGRETDPNHHVDRKMQFVSDGQPKFRHRDIGESFK